MDDQTRESLIALYNGLSSITAEKGFCLSSAEIFAHAVRLESARIVANSIRKSSDC